MYQTDNGAKRMSHQVSASHTHTRHLKNSRQVYMLLMIGNPPAVEQAVCRRGESVLWLFSRGTFIIMLSQLASADQSVDARVVAVLR